MATQTEAKAAHGTLTADEVDDVTLTDPGPTVWIINRSGDELFYTYGDDPDDPEVEGADSFCVPGSAAVWHSLGAGQVTVKLVSGGTPGYSVQAP